MEVEPEWNPARVGLQNENEYQNSSWLIGKMNNIYVILNLPRIPERECPDDWALFPSHKVFSLTFPYVVHYFDQTPMGPGKR
jgi:hypothetical protein